MFVVGGGVVMQFFAYFAAGLFLANGIPHFTNGVSGRRFQSPFAKPPGVGESSPISNVVWGLANLLLGYVLIFGVGEFEFGLSLDAGIVLAGFFIMSLFLAWYFDRVRNQGVIQQDSAC
jgi:hypothetical protein